MIVTVTLNPCRDKTQIIEHFTYGGMNRVVESRQDLGGKGINVSVALAGLRVPSICLGFNFERDADELVRTINKYGIKDDFILSPGGIRVNTKVFERDTSVMTEINEKGDFVPQSLFEALKSKVARYSTQVDVIVFSGSAPKGITEECYAELIACARSNAISNNPNIKIILDAEGSLLNNGLKAKPDIIKPNIFELETFTGVSLNSFEIILVKCREIISQYGVRIICVSMGDKGAVIAEAERAYFAPPLPLKVRGLQGAGDSMVAGICLSIIEDKPISEILRYAVTAASASVEREGTLLCTKEDFDRIYPHVSIQEI